MLSGSSRVVRMRSILRYLVLACFLSQSLVTGLAQTQVFSSALTGIVHDSTGAVVPQATVTISSPETGVRRSFRTSDDGRYTFTLLPPGTYVLAAQKDGFQPISQSGINLALGQTATVDVALRVGSTAQEVNITADSPLLESSDANVSSNIDERAAVELPLNLRNVYGLVLLNSAVNNKSDAQWQAGSYQASADQDVAFLNFGGTRFGSTAYLLDGHWNSGSDWDAVIYVPGVDELEEMKLQTNTFSAQYGWTMGSVVNAITKSGTSHLHGDAFEFVRNSALDSNNYFNNRAGVSRPDFKRNQFGASLGGPLEIPFLYHQRDKTYFFASYEGLRQQSPVTLVTTVPTDNFRNGNFSAMLGAQTGVDALGRPILAGQIYNPFSTRQIKAGQVDPVTGLIATQSGYIRDPFGGNTIPPQLMDTVAKNIVQFWPAAMGNDLVNNFTAAGAAPTSSDQYTVRIDHNVNDSTRLFGRWSQKREYKQEQAPLFGSNDPGGPGSRNPNNRWDFALNLTHVVSPTFLMGANLGWNRWVEATTRQGVPFDPASIGLPSFLNTKPGAFPYINVDGVATLGSSQDYAIPREDRTFAVDFTKIHGAHSLNFGFTFIDLEYRDTRVPTASFTFPVSFTQGPDPISPTEGTGAGFASFLLGAANSGSFARTAAPALRKGYLGWYLQDDYKVTPNLTVNLGARYDLQTAPSDRFNRLASFDFKDPNPISDAVGFTVPGYLKYASGGVYQPEYKNFAPRIGISYSPWQKLVARGGFGLLYTTAMAFPGGGQDMPGYSATTPFVGTLDQITPFNTLSNPFPEGEVPVVGSSQGAMTNVGQDTIAIASSRPTPYVEQWTFGLQYALTKNDSLEAQYIGNHGVKLPISGGIQRNEIPDKYLALGNQLLNPVSNPFYGHIASSGCGLDQATVTYGQLLRPYPEFCSVYELQAPLGSSSYNAAEFKYSHRWSAGLQVLASFTVSKFIDNTTGTEGWSTLAGPEFRSYNNLAAERSLDGNDIPKSLVVSYVYELPFGTGKKFGAGSGRMTNAILGGWQVSGISTFKDGFPLSFAAANNNSGSFGGNQRPNIIGDVYIDHPSINEWFNTNAFAQPQPYTFGNTPRTTSNLRSPGYTNWDIAVQKWWTLTERARLQFRSEIFNAFNHPNFTAPNTTFGSPQFGTITSAFSPRDIQFAVKLYW
jgi:hypothetical protein